MPSARRLRNNRAVADKPETVQAAPAIACQECPAIWTDDSRWRLYLTRDEQPEAVFYCPECAEREFGADEPS
jgi:hypothetical protein